MYKKTKTLVGLAIICGSMNAQNLVENGNFEAGDTGFEIAYDKDCPNDPWPADVGTWHEGAPSDGQYCVYSSYDWSSSFAGWNAVVGDASIGTGGNFLHVNGETTADAKVWCQTITDITPNTNYKFSTWITSIHSDNPAQLQFSVNGTKFGELITASSTPNEWSLFFEVWDSQLADTAEVCIVNQNTVSNGNDFALDNISFEPLSFRMPNIFVPDGDGVNDVFTPLNFAGINTYELVIFNRWGKKIKTITNADMATPAWDGLSKGGNDCSSGVYYWTIKYDIGVGAEQQVKSENGFVHLVRNS